MDEASVAVLIPLFGIIMIICVVIGPVWIVSYFRSRERAQLHETLRAAYEKGLPPPPELIDKLAGGAILTTPTSPDYDLRRAIIMISVGIGLVLLGLGLGFGIGAADFEGGWITGAAVAGAGGIPGMIGIGHLILWLSKRKTPRVAG
jgi:hypothetical protein